ncbi:MAG: hypothetical protein WD529_01090, partial [Balneolaceae bacterium]
FGHCPLKTACLPIPPPGPVDDPDDMVAVSRQTGSLKYNAFGIEWTPPFSEYFLIMEARSLILPLIRDVMTLE